MEVRQSHKTDSKQKTNGCVASRLEIGLQVHRWTTFWVCSGAPGMMTYFFENSCIRFHQGSKHEKTVGSTRPQTECFYCSTVFEQLLNHASGIKENGNIEEFFTCCHFMASAYFKNSKANRICFFFIPQCTSSVYTKSGI